MTQLPSQSSALFTVLKVISAFLPGNFLKTWFYLNLVARPRKLCRRILFAFYRIDHIYEVLQEARRYEGEFTILEFGTAAGYAFAKMLYATKYLKLGHRVTVHAFDTFEGLPPADQGTDDGLVDIDWGEGQFKGDYDRLSEYCRARYKNWAIHKGRFEDTLTDEFCQSLREEPPLLIWIDCDYYSSTKTVFDRILPYVPNGCVIYFDDYEFNYGSRLTCEARFVHELNRGDFGNDMELVLDRDLSLDSRRIYRFVRAEPCIRYRLSRDAVGRPPRARPIGNDSPLP